MAMAIAIASANGSATFIEATDHPRWFGSTPNDSCAIYFRCNLGQVSATDTGINQSTTRDLSRYGRANTKLAVISTVIYTRNKSFTYFC